MKIMVSCDVGVDDVIDLHCVELSIYIFLARPRIVL